MARMEECDVPVGNGVSVQRRERSEELARAVAGIARALRISEGSRGTAIRDVGGVPAGTGTKNDLSVIQEETERELEEANATTSEEQDVLGEDARPVEAAEEDLVTSGKLDHGVSETNDQGGVSTVNAVIPSRAREEAEQAEVTEFSQELATPALPTQGSCVPDSVEAKEKAVEPQESSGNVTSRVIEGDEQGEAEQPKERDGLFTDEELDAWERGAVFPAREEKEEYDKELEDRLYPLDEVELKRRMQENATRLKPLSLAEMSKALGITEDSLARTMDTSLGESAQPEYWLKWFDETLSHSDEAKRANRDFRTPLVSAVTKPRERPKGSTRGNVTTGHRVGKGEDLTRDLVLNYATKERLGKHWRTVARRMAYKLTCDSAGVSWSKEIETPGAVADVPPERDKNSVSEFPLDEALRLAREVGLVAGTRLHALVMKLTERTYTRDAWRIVRKRGERAREKSPIHVSEKACKKLAVPTLQGKRVHFEDSRTCLGDTEAGVQENEESAVERDVVTSNDQLYPATEPSRSRGLVGPLEVSDEDVKAAKVRQSERVICSVRAESVDGVEAVSSGYLDDYPVELLVDSGAVASLVDRNVLKLLGRAEEPLRPCSDNLNSVTGSPLRLKGVIDLRVRLGSQERLFPFVVAEGLHTHTILGTNVLKAFRAVVDMDEGIMTLKDTGETFCLGMEHVEKVYSAATLRTVQLGPGGQALVVTTVPEGVEDGTTVLVEEAKLSSPSVRAARSVCTVTGGRVLVELCNASTEEVSILKDTLVAYVTEVPESAFRMGKGVSRNVPDGDVDQVIGAVDNQVRPEHRPDDMTELEKELKKDEQELHIDFSDSKLSPEQQELLAAELNKFRDLFVETSKKPGRTDLLEFSIDTGDAVSFKLPPYRVSKAEGDVMEAEIQQYLDLGIIRPSTSPWASPVLMIRKPDGGIRFCVDYRRLNAVTIKDCYPMPLIDDILDVLGDARLFSTMDIASGYWNVPMAKDSIAKTAFTSKFGLYEWLVMPFGLCNAVPAFERLMENVLVDLKWRTCLVYLDDCVVFSRDFPTHLFRLRQVLDRFRSAGFKLKMKKCHWGKEQVAFLGHIVTPSGILPNPEKVKAVLNVARPRDLHTVRAFLGLTSYFRRYIPGYAAISAPIEKLKQKGVEFMWTEDCEAAFRQLKRKLMKPPILVYPDFKKRFKLYVDSSHLAVGACLMQEVDGHDRAVAYASKLLVGSERNWVNKESGTSEIECWGIIWATRKFRCYLDRREFDLYTDHKALTWVFSPSNRTSNAKLARWAMELSQLRFKVFHKPGTAMGHADGLSRLYQTSVNAVTTTELLKKSHMVTGQASSKAGERGTLPEDVTTTELIRRAYPEMERDAQVEQGSSTTQLLQQVYGDTHASGKAGEQTSLPPNGNVPEEPTEAGPAPLEADADRGAVEEEPHSDPQREQEEEERLEPGNAPLSPLDMVGLDSERFRVEQQRTPWIQALVAFLQDGALALDAQLRTQTLQMAPNFVVINGILKRKVHLGSRGGHARTVTVPVIPLAFIETVLHFCHADVLAAHVGQKKTVDKVRRHAYWHGWKRDVIEYVRACEVCGSGKGYRPWRNGLMQRMPVQQLRGPFSLLVVDAVGPLIETERGNKYILVFADYFTRWVEAFAVAALDTITFVNVMIDGVISRHGVPDQLLSDRGSNFTSDLARSLYETLGIKKLFGAAYHPQTQGLVERFNGTLMAMLKMYVNETQQDWDLYLPRVLFAYRTSFHEALGDSPFFSLYGRDPVLPLDLAFLNTSKDWKSSEVAEYRRKVFLSLRDTRRLVERQLIKAQDKHQRRLERQVQVQFTVGDPVWVYQFFRARRGEKTTKKLAFAWHGPYRVVGRLGDNTYKIAIPSHPDRVVSVNVNRMKPFKGLWSRPYPAEAPEGERNVTEEQDEGPLAEGDLPSTSFVERLTIGGEETAFANAQFPVVEVLASRVENHEKQYLVLLATYETQWIAASALRADYAVLVEQFESTERSKKGLPALKRSVRLAEANAAAGEDNILF